MRAGDETIPGMHYRLGGGGAKIWEPGAMDEGLMMSHSGKEFLRVS